VDLDGLDYRGSQRGDRVLSSALLPCSYDGADTVRGPDTSKIGDVSRKNQLYVVASQWVPSGSSNYCAFVQAPIYDLTANGSSTTPFLRQPNLYPNQHYHHQTHAPRPE
jgi:hypothetical protein